MSLSDLTLTAEQQAIVDHPLAPLRVAAGAGTGKTTTIVARLVAAIEAGMQPESAVGITFTNKAAEELADRLRGELGAYAVEGREVEVTTYHGFALRLVTEFGAVEGVERHLQVVGPGYVRQLLHESVGERPYRHLDLTAVAQRVDEAASLGSQLSGNLLDPELVVRSAPAPLDEPWQRRLELLAMLQRYRDRKRRIGVVDYGDLIHLAHRIVTRHPALAGRIRRRYALVVLDEYQDTDPAQRELLRAIFGNGFPITAVGDADQTIYEWRGASLENFDRFPDHFPAGADERAATLPLTLNRRSGAGILAVANAIRAELPGARSGDHLRPAHPIADDVAVGWFRTAWDEATWIAEEIRRLHDDDGVPWRAMAVLFRKNRHIAMVRDALHQAEVPHEVASLGGLLSVPEVADVHAWLRILARPHDGAALVRILLGGRYRLGLGDLAPLAAWVHRQNRCDDATLLGFSLLEAIDVLPQIPDLDPVARQRLAEFRATYRRLLTEAQGVSLVDLVRAIVDAVEGWSEVAAMPAVASLSARLNLYRFFDLVEVWSPLAGRPSLEGFLGYLDLLAEDRTSDELDTARVSSHDAVSLLTVHRAKGLEWDTVFLPALVHNVFPARSQGFDDPYVNAKWLPYDLRLDAENLPVLPSDGVARKALLRQRHDAAELRTAYVAVTRAQRRLTLTGAAWYDGVRPAKPSRLLELGRAMPAGRTITWCEDPGPPPGDRPGAAEPPDPLFPDGWRAALRATLEDPRWPERQASDSAMYEENHRQLEMMLDGLPQPPSPPAAAEPSASVTGLVTLATCPQQFAWSEIDPLPRRPAPWLARGTSLHRRIELHHQGIVALDFEDHPAAGPDEAAPEAGVDRFASFLGSRFATAQPVMIEAPLDMVVSGTRIRGRVDAIFEPEPGVWEIVDYKSGKRRSDPAAQVQLEAYAVAAVDGALASVPPARIAVTFAYFGTDPAEEVTIEVTPDWLAAARTRLEELARAAAGDEFTPRPSPTCHHCDFRSFCEAGPEWAEAHPVE